MRALRRKERARQWRIVPAYAPAGIGDHLQGNMGRRKGVIEELALTWYSALAERARPDNDSRPRAFRAHDARGRCNVLFFFGAWGLERGAR